MSTASENIISNTSYTEKDFNSIYQSMLDLVRKLTSKWDPSASNESDPGVLLLKLDALVADKCNYNSDKNVLECFPLSVTQEENARQLFEQLGYYMHWYKAAYTYVNLQYHISTDGDNSSGGSSESSATDGYISITVPRFTMVTDSERKIVYTIVEEKELPVDGTIQTFLALQGVANTYKIGERTGITSEDLDSNNRLYFDEINIAENGIFIQNIGTNNFSSWTKVDNLLQEDLSQDNKCYKFGVSQDLAYCYIEFPQNAEEIFQDGIKITYIRTDGEDGNIKALVLDSFYEDVTTTASTESSGKVAVALSSSNTVINNLYIGTGGASKESIDDAYIGYKRIAGTYDTIVTLRDYLNAVINSPYVSNAIVTDRTNDQQSSYGLMTKIVDVSQCASIVKKDSGDNPEMTAFDLKLYLLGSVASITSSDAFNKTFDLSVDESIDLIVKAELNDYKIIQHDFANILKNRVCLFHIKYPIKCTIVPQYQLTEDQSKEVSASIIKALYENLNSSKLTFGDEIDFDTIYDIIKNSDSKIKYVVLDRLTYTVTAQYIDDSGKLCSVDIDDNFEFDSGAISTNSMKNKILKDIYAKSVVSGKTQFYIKDTQFTYSLNHTLKAKQDNVYSISTEALIPFSNNEDSWTYLIKENESVQMYSPSLIQSENYSSGIKFEYTFNTSGEVSPNSYYQLADGEFIAFYYTTTTSADTGYVFNVYGKGTIINPTFTIQKTQNELKCKNHLPGEGDLKTVGSYQFRWLSGNTLNVSDAEEFTAAIKSITDSSHLLSSGKEIGISVKNSIKLNSSTDVAYWITQKEKDNNGDDVYYLFELDADGKRKDNRILKPNEYFIYSASGGNDLHILGSGTSITRLSGDDDMKVVAIDYSEIVSTGVSALSDYWYKALNRNGIDVTEMSYTNFGEGTYVNIRPKDKTAEGQRDYTEWFEGDGTTTSYNLKFVVSISGTSRNIDVYVNGSKVSSGYSITDDVSGDFSILTFNSAKVSGAKIEIKYDVSKIVLSNAQVFIDGFIVRYRESIADVWTTLPDVNADSLYKKIGTDYLYKNGFIANSRLRVDVSTDKQQHIIGRQSITYYYIDGSTTGTGTITPAENEKNLYLLSSKSLISSGGNNIDTTDIDSSGNSIYSSIYSYSMRSDTSSAVTLSDGSIEFIFKANSSPAKTRSVSLGNFKVPQGDYIIPIYHSIAESDDIVSICANDGSGNLNKFGVTGTGSDNIKNVGYSYLKLSSNGSGKSFKITITFKDAATESAYGDLHILVRNTYKFGYPTFSDDSTKDGLIRNYIEGEVFNLNKEYLLFDYTYTVNEDDKVSDPFDGKNFLNYNHIYNSISIPKLDMTSVDIHITNRTR